MQFESRLPLSEHEHQGSGRAKFEDVEKSVQMFRSFDDADRADDEFYADLAPEERVDLLLELVERQRSALGETASRFERVHRIVELSRR